MIGPHSKRRIELAPKIQKISFVIGIFCLLAVAASLFSLPFPFVRQMWISEVLGISGLLQVMAFLIILRQIEKHHSIPALLAGVGLVLNEIFLSLRGFWILISLESVNTDSLVYFVVSIITELLLLVVLTSVFHAFYMVRKTVDQHTVPPVKLDPVAGARLLIPSILLYGGMFGAAIYILNSWQGPMQFALLKNLAWITSAASMAAIGMEINDYIDGLQGKKICCIKIVTHGACFAAVLWVIYRIMPVESVLLLS